VNAATPTCWKIKSKEEEETESSGGVGVQLITLISSSPKFSAKQSNSRKPSKKRNTKILDADHGLTDHLGNDERALRLLVTNAMERKHTHTHTHTAGAGNIRRKLQEPIIKHTDTHPTLLHAVERADDAALVIVFSHPTPLVLASILAHVHLSLFRLSLSLSLPTYMCTLTTQSIFTFFPVCAKAQLYVYVANVRVYVYISSHIYSPQSPTL
jgi:hypothetical protein